MSTRVIHFMPLPQVKGLSGLVDESRVFADLCLRTTGSVAPTMLVLTPRGLLIHAAESMGTEEEKERFALECRLLLAATGATAYAMVLEAWMAEASEGELPHVRPAEHPRRIEVVMIGAESRKESRFLTLPICRSSLGIYVELGENTTPGVLQARGRFAGLLPIKQPSSHVARAAKNALRGMHVYIETPIGGFSQS